MSGADILAVYAGSCGWMQREERGGAASAGSIGHSLPLQLGRVAGEGWTANSSMPAHACFLGVRCCLHACMLACCCACFLLHCTAPSVPLPALPSIVGLHPHTPPPQPTPAACRRCSRCAATWTLWLSWPSPTTSCAASSSPPSLWTCTTTQRRYSTYRQASLAGSCGLGEGRGSRGGLGCRSRCRPAWRRGSGCCRMMRACHTRAAGQIREH